MGVVGSPGTMIPIRPIIVNNNPSPSQNPRISLFD